MVGKEIILKLLFEVICILLEEKRIVIFLYYFEGMIDVEIGKMFNMLCSMI